MGKRLLYLFFFIFLLLQTKYIEAQNIGEQNLTDYQVAMQYYRNGEFEKAVTLYKKLYFSNRSHNYFYYYFDCLQKLKDYPTAEKLVKEQIKFNKENLSYRVDLGYLYQIQNENSKAKSEYNAAIKRIRGNRHQIIQLAYEFINKRLFDYAEKTFEQGKKILKNSYEFETEMAQMYYYQRNYEKMIAEYLKLLKKSKQYLQMVQNHLQNAVYNDIDGSLKGVLKTALIKEINKNPEQTTLSELLIWLYIQDADFENAFLQARALDRRLNENGKRLIALARIATNNSNFDVAVKAYEYVIAKGEMLEYFFAARNEMLNLMFKRIKLGLDTQKSDFIRLENSYAKALEEEGIRAETAEMVKNLAHLKAFYLGKTAEAWFMLENSINIKGLDKISKGELELELADIYLVADKIWDATFAYARIEEYNKNNKIGAEAKFRKARLAYFIGNPEWAKAQLDVLKASTSKLPANDAAHLSLLIYDNTGWGDTNEVALKMYARADLKHFQSQDSLALLILDTLLNKFPDNELIDEAWLLKAKVFFKQQKLEEAADAYLQIIEKFPDDILADRALFSLGNIFENHLNKPNEALKYYQQLLTTFKGSIYTVEARKRYRTLRGDKLIN